MMFLLRLHTPFWISLCLVSQIYVCISQYSLNNFEETYNSSVPIEDFIDFDKDGFFDLEEDGENENESSSGNKSFKKLVDFSLTTMWALALESFKNDSPTFQKKIYASPYLHSPFRPPRSYLFLFTAA